MHIHKLFPPDLQMKEGLPLSGFNSRKYRMYFREIASERIDLPAGRQGMSERLVLPAVMNNPV
jgi:hypothetical protein